MSGDVKESEKSEILWGIIAYAIIISVTLAIINYWSGPVLRFYWNGDAGFWGAIIITILLSLVLACNYPALEKGVPNKFQVFVYSCFIVIQLTWYGSWLVIGFVQYGSPFISSPWMVLDIILCSLYSIYLGILGRTQVIVSRRKVKERMRDREIERRKGEIERRNAEDEKIRGEVAREREKILNSSIPMLRSY